ncbi:PREDICTED: protein TIC 100 isoform X2 [Camelina sativa]|uniref:Protein TIC 100 isoform X1 n=1 Tax=Camelina sativa TaxID=90675 RepID=A0ABM0XZU3_CAMSA|nr:PREDICTED: protein TIC 100 isoform X1 [Camelina sativa]XP_010493357.1 PREDICTED: protein TIC 100 isoform X2 [Camelina sativa]
MANDELTESKQDPSQQSPNANEENGSDSDSDSSSQSSGDDFYISESENEAKGEEEEEEDNSILNYVRPSDIPPDPNANPETNIRRFNRVLDGKRVKRMEEEEEDNYTFYEDLFDFPRDPERWKEEDLREIWADGPLDMTKPGWDPVWADEDDWDVVNDEIEEGRDPEIQPFYVPYRKPYPAIPDNHFDIENAKGVVEELDRIEEFLQWVSYIFPDGSSYEGTVWDDLAQGKGVYIAEDGLVRYEGEWLQNDMDGHGVVEVDIPDIEPMPGSKLEAKMRAEGRIIKRDYMSPEDRKWLEMDVEDSVALTNGNFQVPFYENEEWVNQFGEKPEKGRYRYAGQWKHSRMHGCGVYEVNERILYGRFYFGELLEEEHGCTVDICALHSGLAEVAAAKARMFVNKPDGMIREERGPYGDPQHPYFYEEEDVWMAPGFINQFYDVPEYWETYVDEVDQEREMWLNSFYKAPLRLPMPAELEHWWKNVEVTPEFVLLNKEPEPDPEDPSKLVQTEDPVILHTPTGRIINYVEDEKHGIRLFWQPTVEEGGEEVDLSKVEFLPLGFDEFYGKEVAVKKEHPIKRFILGIEKSVKPMIDGLEKWTEEKKKTNEERKEMIQKELELVEAEICLEEAIEDMDEELKLKEQEEEKKTEMGLTEDDDFVPVQKEEKVVTVKEKIQEKKPEEKYKDDDDEDDDDGEGGEDDDDDDDDDDLGPSSFGSADKGRRNSPFSSSSLSFASCTLFPAVQSRLERSFLAWKQHRAEPSKAKPGIIKGAENTSASIHFPPLPRNKPGLKMAKASSNRGCIQRSNGSSRSQSQLMSLSRQLSCNASSSSSSPPDNNNSSNEDLRDSGIWKTPVGEMSAVLSLQIHTKCCDMFAETPPAFFQ